MFKQITIIGFGHIGSSLARGIKQNRLADTIICADMSRDVCEKVLELDLAGRIERQGLSLIALRSPK